MTPETSHGLMRGPGNSFGYPPGLHERLVAWIVRTAGADSAGGAG